MAMAVELFAPDEVSLAPDDEALLVLLARNHARWLPYNRKAHCWAFYQCVGTHPHSVSASVLRCIICKPDRAAAPNAVTGSSLSSRKGFLKYTNGGGTTPLKNHCRDHHRRLVDALKTRIGGVGENAPAVVAVAATSSAADSKKRKTVAAAAASEIATQFSSPASYYSSSSSHQQQQQDVFIEDLILYVCKALRPISTTENVWFRRLLLHQVPRLVFPSRCQITDKYLPAMIRTLDVETVRPLLSKCVTGSASFDLWMSRGTTDVFAVCWHFIDNNWELQNVTIGMFQALPSVGSHPVQLLPLFRKYDLERRCLAYVKDDSGNLDTTGAALDEIAFCNLFQLAHPFPGDCFAHAALKMCTYGTDDAKVAIGLPLISIERTQSVLRKTIACLRKSGAQEWSKACIDSGLVPKEMKTPVKMRFASKISMFHTLIEYKPAVNRWYGLQPSTVLRNRVPSSRTWAIASVVTETLEPVLHACIVNRSRGHWLISDAVNSIMTISTQFAKVLPPLPQCHSSDGFEVQLHALRINIRAQVVQVLDPFLEFAVAFQSNKAHNMLALMLDPRFKSMRALSKFRGKSIAKELIKEYDDKVLIPFLIMAHENIYPASAEGDNGNEDQRSGSDSEDDVFKTAWQVVGNVEELVKNELMQFRTFKVGPDQPTAPLAWWKQHACMFPVIAFTARQFLATPGSQIEVERIFSIAGILTSLCRANLGVQNLESILLIGKNWSDDPRFETSSAAAPSLKSFFDSEASLIEDHEDELHAAGLFEDGEENIE